MYHIAADICQKTENGESLKTNLYGSVKGRHAKDIPAIRALVDTTLRNRRAIDDLIGKTNLAREIVFNEIWIARVLVTELVYGKKSYHVTDEISKKVYQYKEELKNLSEHLKRIERAFVPRYCRINTLLCTKAEFHSALSEKYSFKEIGGKSEITYKDFLKIVKNLKENEYIRDYHLADLFIFHTKANLTGISLYQENKIILQDKASCLVAPLLAPTPDSLIIDMCAAPGLKTQHLSAISGGSGLILAIDINKERYNVLANTRINYDMSNVMTFNADALHLPEKATKCIEYILLDAPCSGSGVVQNFKYGSRFDEKRLSSLHNLQCYLLKTALTKYTSARRIVYSTCSITEEENEAVVDEMLPIAEENQYNLVNLKNHLQDMDSGLEKYKCGKNVIRLLPEKSYTNGFFIALFERTNPKSPTSRMEFYKCLNEIIAEISCKKKRKADEAELNVVDKLAEGNDNSIYENSLEKVESPKFKKHNANHSEDETSWNENLDDSKFEGNVKETETNDNDSSDSEDEEMNTINELKPVAQEKSLIRVVRSPLLKNPIIQETNEEKQDETSSSDSEEDSDDSEQEQHNTTPQKNNNLKLDENTNSYDGKDSLNINITENNDDNEESNNEFDELESPCENMSNKSYEKNCQNQSFNNRSNSRKERGGHDKSQMRNSPDKFNNSGEDWNHSGNHYRWNSEMRNRDYRGNNFRNDRGRNNRGYNNRSRGNRGGRNRDNFRDNKGGNNNKNWEKKEKGTHSRY